MSYALFFFNDTATTEIYTLSLHDALPISLHARADLAAGHLAHLQPEGHVVEHRHLRVERVVLEDHGDVPVARRDADRKSTRLNSSHANISYAVFCLKNRQRRLLLRDGRRW